MASKKAQATSKSKRLFLAVDGPYAGQRLLLQHGNTHVFTANGMTGSYAQAENYCDTQWRPACL